MACAVCMERPEAGQCGDCQKLICTHCGKRCAECGKIVCPDHMKSHNGKASCLGCLAARERARQEAIGQQPTEIRRSTPAQPAPPKEPSSGGFSFQELQAELGDGPKFSGGQPEPRSEQLVNPDTGLEETYDPDVDAKLAALLGEEEGKVRMEALGGASPRGTAAWISGLFGGGASLLLCALITPGASATMLQPFMSYFIFCLAIGTLIWCGYGAAQQDETPMNRALTGIPIAMALVAVLLAWLWMGNAPATSY